MKNFTYTSSTSPEEALAALMNGAADTKLLAGGTDLIPLMKDQIVTPSRLVEIAGWKDGSYISETGGSLRIGATTPLSELASSEMIPSGYTALAQACKLAATPQLRNMGTIGGNLLQQTRCWYYRGEQSCWLKGGDTCFARDGENELHAIFLNTPDQSPCVSAHPSDPAVALLALDATVGGTSAAGEFEIPADELFSLPTEERRNFVALPESAVITHITIPQNTAQTRSIYLKAMPRATWAFALASVAIRITVADGLISDARVALGGVAPIPFRVNTVERRLRGQQPGSLDHAALSAELVANAYPLSQNRYKVKLLQALFNQALDEI